MDNMYAMRRANGDWFAFEEGGRLRLPVFGSSHAAMQARALNWGMLLFKPAIFDEHALNAIAPAGSKSGVYFWLADGSSTRLSHGHLIDRVRLASLMCDPAGQSPQ